MQNDRLDIQAKQDYSISMLAANVYSLLIAIPLFASITGVYGIVWGMERLGRALLLVGYIPFLLLIIVGTVVHELLHAAGWIYFGHLPRGTVKIRLHLKTLTPYAHCTELLDIRPYRLGGLLPGLALGFIPALLGILTGYGPLMTFGMLFSLAASGDLLSLWILRHVPPGSQVEDHPSRVGCYVIVSDKG